MTASLEKRWERRWCAALVVLAMLVVLWIRVIPMLRTEPELRYRGGDGREHVYLGDYDSYVWLRHARNYLRTGTTCDAVVDGECRDTYDHAPVGVRMIYHRSLHIAAIVAVHRLITLFSPNYPLPASAYWVPVIVGVLGVVPAFAIGWRLAGPLAGLAAALVIGVNPIFLQRSLGSDNDVWNLVLPLFMMWAAIEALRARTSARQAGGAFLVAAVAGLHAATWSGWWFTYAVLLAGLLADVVVRTVRAVRARGWRVWNSSEVRGALLVLAVVYGAAGVLVTAAGAGESYFGFPLTLLRSVLGQPHATGAAPPGVAYWPDVMQTVAELTRPNLGRIASYMAGNLVFFIGWLGLLVLLLPRRQWQWWHFIVLIAGNFLYRYLLTADVGHVALVVLLLLPLLVAMLLYVFADDEAAAGERDAGLIVAVWFLAAIFLSYRGLRFIMLLVPPAAIAFAVAIGRLQQFLSALLATRRLAYARFIEAVIWLALAAVLLLPVQQGYLMARSYTPRINDAWWDTLTMLRDSTPRDAIVNTWWDYGYWIKYVAERRVSAAGASLQTHIPHWLGRTLLAADERESIGLLRMLNCGSDATPLPEGRQGAYGKLLAYGVDEIAAHDMILDLAKFDVEPARAYLSAHGLSEAAQRDVLAATHCAPPPTYVMLSSELIFSSAWQSLGGWDLRRAYLAEQVHALPEGEMMQVLTTRFGYSDEAARALYRDASAIRSDADVDAFGAPRSRLLTTRWVGCQRLEDKSLVCRIDLRPDRSGMVLDSVVYAPERPGDSRLRFRGAVDRSQTAGVTDKAPAAVLVAGESGLITMTPASADQSDLAILVDVGHARILVGTPAVLASTFVHLMFLDSRYARYFEKVADRVGYQGERVVTWRVNWQGDHARDVSQ
jgi:dolichyl-diphosphooligosaccharide--protein glycosyltransferase